MTTMEKVSAGISAIANQVFDKEPLNYLEVAGLYAIVAAGRHNMVSLEVLYNHARDPELKALIRRAIDEQTDWLINKAEHLLQASDGLLPTLHFARRKLHDSSPDLPDDAHFSDQEIVGAIASMAKASQTAVLSAMHQTYQPEVAQVYRRILDAAFDFNYSLLQLALDKGWLPHMAKVKH
ncbi:MAG TPA: DUF3231 family protein [Selenomonadales bacterium]|nr:DUF3231 family protein [Selenomonadales bacterium]